MAGTKTNGPAVTNEPAVTIHWHAQPVPVAPTLVVGAQDGPNEPERYEEGHEEEQEHEQVQIPPVPQDPPFDIQGLSDDEEDAEYNKRQFQYNGGRQLRSGAVPVPPKSPPTEPARAQTEPAPTPPLTAEQRQRMEENKKQAEQNRAAAKRRRSSGGSTSGGVESLSQQDLENLEEDAINKKTAEDYQRHSEMFAGMEARAAAAARASGLPACFYIGKDVQPDTRPQLVATWAR
jgi:hypothetical protein